MPLQPPQTLATYEEGSTPSFLRYNAAFETAMQATLRIAQQNDLELLLEFVRDYYAIDHIPFDRNKAGAALSHLVDENATGFVWLIHAESEVVGYIILTLGYSLEYQGRDAFIDELYICAPFRGRGYGNQAMALVEKEAQQLNVQALHLEVERENTGAQGLYRRLGYEDHDRYLMTKRLQPGAA